MFPKVMEWLYIYQACLKKLKRMKRKVCIKQFLTSPCITSHVEGVFEPLLLTMNSQCSNILDFK